MLQADVIRLLFHDVFEMPIITNRRHEMWLGIQIRAKDWLDRLSATVGPCTPSLAPAGLLMVAYKTLIAHQSELEVGCLRIEGLPLPRIGAWATELLQVRQNVFELSHSALRRFVRMLCDKATESVKGDLVGCTFDVAELLCLLPDSVLGNLAESEQESERLLSEDEMAIHLETAAGTETFVQAVKRRARVARDTLVTGYLRLVLRMARNHADQGVDYADLVQEGFIGLMRAAERYNYREHARFVQYAANWVWQGIGRAIADHGRTIRLPVHLHEQVLQLEDAYKILSDGSQDCPNPVDILLQMKLLPESELLALKKAKNHEVALVGSIPRRYQKALKRVHRLMAYAQPTVSLDLILPHGLTRDIPVFASGQTPEEITLSDLVPDRRNLTPDTAVERAIVRSRIDEMLKTLTSRERDVITLRFGLEDSQARTLEEIGQEFGVTRERIRQIEAKAIEKLTYPISKNLALYEVGLPKDDPDSLPLGVLAYLDREFSCWRNQEAKSDDQKWDWLDELIVRLPGGDSQRVRLKETPTRRDQLLEALCALSIPSHYSDITEQVNDLLEGEELEEGYVYLLLTKHEETFILLGQGAFSLVEWERSRAAQAMPVLPFCPSPLPDPPNQNDTFFESVVIARDILKHQPTTEQFLKEMFNWAGAPEIQACWFQQSVLSTYYLVGLIPYIFCFDGSNPRLECTLPEMGLHELRRYCLQGLTERLMAMPEFWWVFQRYQPARQSALGERFAEIHPFGLDDAINRLSILTSLGASQRLTYGQYRLTQLGEELAEQWKKPPTFAHSAETIQNPQPEDDLEPVDLAIW